MAAVVLMLSHVQSLAWSQVKVRLAMTLDILSVGTNNLKVSPSDSLTYISVRLKLFPKGSLELNIQHRSLLACCKAATPSDLNPSLISSHDAR